MLRYPTPASGTFPWREHAERQPNLNDPDPSYQGKTWIAYESIEERLDDLDGIKAGDDSVQPLKGALAKLTNAAAGN